MLTSFKNVDFIVINDMISTIQGNISALYDSFIKYGGWNGGHFWNQLQRASWYDTEWKCVPGTACHIIQHCNWMVLHQCHCNIHTTGRCLIMSEINIPFNFWCVRIHCSANERQRLSRASIHTVFSIQIKSACSYKVYFSALFELLNYSWIQILLKYLLVLLSRVDTVEPSSKLTSLSSICTNQLVQSIAIAI